MCCATRIACFRLPDPIFTHITKEYSTANRPCLLYTSPGTAKVWAASLFLGIVCSGVCLVIQSVFQRHTTASRASLIFTLEPVFSAIFAFFLLGERIGVRGYLGAALMLASLVLVEVDVGALFKKGKKEAE